MTRGRGIENYHHMDSPQAPGRGKGLKREREQNKRSPQAAEAFKGTQILPIFCIFCYSFFFLMLFLPLQMLNGGDYKPRVSFVLLSVKSEKLKDSGNKVWESL